MKKRRLPLWNRVVSGLVFLAAIAVLSGCGGGGSSSPTTTPPSVVDAGVGYFDNVSNNGGADVYSDTANTTKVHLSDLVSFVNGKQIMLVSPSANVAWFATITSLNGTSYTADVRIYKDNVPDGTAKLTGTIISGTSISGTLTGQAYGEGTFSLDYSSDNSQQADVANISRVYPSGWKNLNLASFMSFFIDSSGNVTSVGGGVGVGDFTSCLVTGTVTAIANSHLYKMQITLTGCLSQYAAADGTYTGYVATTMISSADTMMIAFENSTNKYSMYGEFQ